MRILGDGTNDRRGRGRHSSRRNAERTGDPGARSASGRVSLPLRRRLSRRGPVALFGILMCSRDRGMAASLRTVDHAARTPTTSQPSTSWIRALAPGRGGDDGHGFHWLGTDGARGATSTAPSSTASGSSLGRRASPRGSSAFPSSGPPSASSLPISEGIRRHRHLPASSSSSFRSPGVSFLASYARRFLGQGGIRQDSSSPPRWAVAVGLTSRARCARLGGCLEAAARILSGTAVRFASDFSPTARHHVRAPHWPQTAFSPSSSRGRTVQVAWPPSPLEATLFLPRPRHAG